MASGPDLTTLCPMPPCNRCRAPKPTYLPGSPLATRSLVASCWAHATSPLFGSRHISWSTCSCPSPSEAPSAGRYGLLGMLRCLCGSYLCNLVGALLLVGLMVGGEVFDGRGDFVIE